MTIPEFPLTVVAMFLRSPDDTDHAHTPNSASSISSSPPHAQLPASNEVDNVVDVYVTSYAASQFWIAYNVSPLSVSLAPGQTKFIFFKLVLNGNCIVSWGVGEEHEWRGKTMWAFYRGGTGGNGWRTVEKKGFFFQNTEKDREFEIQVFRARGRRRASREFGERVPKGDEDFE